MEVEYNLTPEDVQAFVRVQQQRQKVQKVLVGSRWTWVVLFCLLLSAFALSDGIGASLLWLVLGVILGALGMLVVVIRLNKVAAQSQDEYLKDPRNQWVFATQRVTISPEGFAESSWFGRTVQRWEVIWDIAVTADHAFFWISTRAAHVVPRHAFRDQQQFEEFVALARRYQQGAPTSTAITATPPRPTTITRGPE